MKNQYSWDRIKRNRNNLEILFEMYRNGDEETKRRINLYFRNNKHLNKISKEIINKHF